MSTLTWIKAANIAAGHAVPYDATYVAYSLGYDPVRQQVILHTLNKSNSYSPSTWAYKRPTTAPPPPTPPTGTGKITSFPRPALVTAPFLDAARAAASSI